MINAPTYNQEKERLEALHRLAILDTKPEERFDTIVKEAVDKLGVSMSMISILDKDREWFKSCVGIDQKEGARESSFCGHALLAKDTFIVEDTLKDERFWDNPMVIGSPYIRAYAGIALLDHKSGQPIGVFCVKDTKPRKFSVEEVSNLMELADRAEEEINKK
jgi:GAF domain-containing protein